MNTETQRMKKKNVENKTKTISAGGLKGAAEWSDLDSPDGRREGGLDT